MSDKVKGLARHVEPMIAHHFYAATGNVLSLGETAERRLAEAESALESLRVAAVKLGYSVDSNLSCALWRISQTIERAHDEIDAAVNVAEGIAERFADDWPGAL